MTSDIICPAPLRPGDTIAITSPASKINPDYVEAARRQLTAAGFCVEVMPHACGSHGSYSGTFSHRLEDMVRAICSPHIKAIICSRGGYGAVHLLDELAGLDLRENPKWLVGFSDITALHGLWASQGVISLHAAMTKHIGRGEDFVYYGAEMQALTQAPAFPELCFDSHPLNIPGTTTGRITGGNMAVFGGLIGSPFARINPGSILLMEDIAEPIYKVERILWQMRLAGMLQHVAGVIVGQFTDYKPSTDHTDMYQMIAAFFRPYGIPVAFNAPVGHTDFNHPIPISATATLTVKADENVAVNFQ